MWMDVWTGHHGSGGGQRWRHKAPTPPCYLRLSCGYHSPWSSSCRRDGGSGSPDMDAMCRRRLKVLDDSRSYMCMQSVLALSFENSTSRNTWNRIIRKMAMKESKRLSRAAFRSQERPIIQFTRCVLVTGSQTVGPPSTTDGHKRIPIRLATIYIADCTGCPPTLLGVRPLSPLNPWRIQGVNVCGHRGGGHHLRLRFSSPRLWSLPKRGQARVCTGSRPSGRRDTRMSLKGVGRLRPPCPPCPSSL